jgi:2-polyprenyl-3-methyl-5-hydroxy-6-metoxy-1,4-benzoquinol methylase
MKKLLKKIFLKLDNYASKLANRSMFKRGLISDIEYELRNRFLSEVEQFGTNDFYQNYPPLKISGKRNTLCRYAIYGMEKRLSRDFKVLDIGGNIGFFSLYLSKYVKSIDIVEQNSNLTDIGKRLAEYEKIKNVNIFNQDFKEFQKEEKYDFVMSLAIHKWVGMEFEDYLSKVHSHLKVSGLLLVESHIIYGNDGDYILPKLEKMKEFDIVQKGEIDDHDGKYREFFWLKAK